MSAHLQYQTWRSVRRVVRRSPVRVWLPPLAKAKSGFSDDPLHEAQKPTGSSYGVRARGWPRFAGVLARVRLRRRIQVACGTQGKPREPFNRAKAHQS
jgi:hypothetical protein